MFKYINLKYSKKIIQWKVDSEHSEKCIGLCGFELCVCKQLFYSDHQRPRWSLVEYFGGIRYINNSVLLLFLVVTVHKSRRRIFFVRHLYVIRI